MIDRLIHALTSSQNEAADDVLLESVRLGSPREKGWAVAALFQRKTDRGLGGLVTLFDSLSDALQEEVLANIRLFHHALRESARSSHVPSRVSALRLVALGRQGKLAYVLGEHLHDPDEDVSKTACDALVGLARWMASTVRRLNACTDVRRDAEGHELLPPDPVSFTEDYCHLVDQRGEVEAAIARAIDVHRGRHGSDLLRAAMLLADNPHSKTFQILELTKHGGQSPMVRRLQQAPASEHVPAFLLGASVGHLRTHFGNAFSHVNEPPVLEAILRKTHWLKDHGLQICVQQVTRGYWWEDATLAKDLNRRPPTEAAKIGEWLAASGTHDALQDERLEKILGACRDDTAGRLRLLRMLMRRKRGASVALLGKMIDDTDERIARMAAREIVRRRPVDFENILLSRITSSPESVRKLITRAIGHVGFEHYWDRFDRLPRQTRRQAGRAMLKLLPDAISRLRRKLTSGSVDERIKGMKVCEDLGLAEPLRNQLLQLCVDANPRVRSKAVSVIGQVSSVPPDVLIDRLLNDTDSRVRANTIEVLEAKGRTEFLPALAKRARATNPRERANAIKALHSMRIGAATAQLQNMLRDDRSEHRISALWALRKIGWWQLLTEVGRLAKEDKNVRVRRYAIGVLRGVAEIAAQRRAAVVAPGADGVPTATPTIATGAG
jgi:hypothetical protein